MNEILTITLNPALDLSTQTPVIKPGPKLRCDFPVAETGGGGINVSRAIGHLGGTSHCFVALAGATGARLLELLHEQGITPIAQDLPGETRQSFAVTEQSTGQQYRFVMPGPAWDPADIDRALFRIQQELTTGTIAVLSGSNPPGVPDDMATRIAHLCADQGARLIVDISGPPLAALAGGGGGVDVLRMDAHEAEQLAGRPLPTRIDTAGFAQALCATAAAHIVIVARGADGSTMATQDGAWHAACPVTSVVSAIGAGDSFVAGFALALSQGAAAEEALKYGVAAAAACCLTEGTQLCTLQGTQEALSATTIERLAAN